MTTPAPTAAPAVADNAVPVTTPLPSPVALRTAIKAMIIRACGITHLKPEEVADDEVLFGPESAVGLNSLDAVEIAVNVEIDFGVKMENSSSARQYFRTVANLAGHIASQMEPAKLAAFS
jgi:acyl carrier protein